LRNSCAALQQSHPAGRGPARFRGFLRRPSVRSRDRAASPRILLPFRTASLEAAPLLDSSASLGSLRRASRWIDACIRGGSTGASRHRRIRPRKKTAQNG